MPARQIKKTQKLSLEELNLLKDISDLLNEKNAYNSAVKAYQQKLERIPKESRSEFERIASYIISKTVQETPTVISPEVAKNVAEVISRLPEKNFKQLEYMFKSIYSPKVLEKYKDDFLGLADTVVKYAQPEYKARLKKHRDTMHNLYRQLEKARTPREKQAILSNIQKELLDMDRTVNLQYMAIQRRILTDLKHKK